MTPTESCAADRERQIDEIVLAYLKAREDNSNLQQTWIDRYPEQKVDLADFFRNQDRIERLATLLRLLTNAAETRPASDATLPWVDTDSSKPVSDWKGQQVLGDYEFLEEIGKGGMGLVYKARQRSLKRIVALKMILAGAHASSEELTRFRSEAEAVARLQHPNIVQIYEVGELDHRPFFSLEFVEGGSLAAQLDGTPLPPRSAGQLVRTLAQAIHFAHQQGIVHRDLKPANILLAASPGQPALASKLANQATTGKPPSPTDLSSASPVARILPTVVPKITDFGLAKRLDDESGQTKCGTIMGTPSYMAPEQAAGQKDRVGPATDIYGLGAILYELLTGRPPFKAATPWETVNQVLHNEPVSPRLLDPKVDRDLENICLKCLEKDPQRRYESAQALGEDLQRYLEGRPILARPVSSVVEFWRLCRRHPVASMSLALALASLLVLLVATAIFNRRLQQELAQNEAISRELHMTLTKQVADRIDSDLRQLMRIPTLMATTLSLRSDWREDQLEPWMREILSKDERLFGTAVAFEPQQFDGKRNDFALYAYRAKEGVRNKMLLLPAYKPHYRDWLWYSPVKKQRSPLWSEPFIDDGGGNILMITYSVPILRDEKFAGVVTADLSVAYFDVMRQWLDELKLGKQGYAFVISSTGTFIGHPDPRFQRPLKITQTREFQDGGALQNLTARLLNRDTGSVRAIDPSTDKQSVFYFSPITSAQWSFVVVTEE